MQCRIVIDCGVEILSRRGVRWLVGGLGMLLHLQQLVQRLSEWKECRSEDVVEIQQREISSCG